MTIASLFLSPRGRIGRLAYFLGVVSMMVVQGLVFAMLVASGKSMPAVIIFGVLLLAMSYPHWMLAIKRAHDLGKSAWWLLGNIFLLPVIGAGLAGAAAASAASHNLGTSLILSLASLPFSLASLWVCIKLFFFSGTSGINGFGPPSNFLRHAFGDDDDIPMPVAAAARTRVVMTPPPVAAPASQPKPAAPRPARASGFGRRGLNPA